MGKATIESGGVAKKKTVDQHARRAGDAVGPKFRKPGTNIA